MPQNSAAWVSLVFTVGTYILYAFYFYQDAQKPLEKQQRPEKVTWLIWSGVDAIIASAMWFGGNFAPQMWIYVIGSGAIAAYDFYRDPRHWHLTQNDKKVVAGAIAAMILWYITSGVAAIAISLVAVTIGSLQLWKDTWEKPETIPWKPWALFLVGGIAGAISSVQLHGWTWIDDLGPGTFVIFQVLTLGLALGVWQHFFKSRATA